MQSRGMLSLARNSRLRAPRFLSTFPPHQVLGFPSLSPTMTTGNIGKYLVKVGDEIQAGDRVSEIETDKATVDFDVVDGGFVAKFLLEEGAQEVAIGTPMIVICEEAADVAAFADFTATVEAAPQPAAAPTADAPAPAPPPAPPAPAPTAAAAPAPAPVQLGTVTLPAAGGRIYYNEVQCGTLLYSSFPSRDHSLSAHT